MSYRYAVIKDGKIVLPDSLNALGCLETDYEEDDVILNSGETETNRNSGTEVDLSKITGRNLITGQTISLEGYIQKIMGRMQQNGTFDVEPNRSGYRRETRTLSDTSESAGNTRTLVAGMSVSGKKLTGKIVRIEKRGKPDARRDRNVAKNDTIPCDTLDYVSRTLEGLMKMESVSKKLLGKNLKIKLIEKKNSEKLISHLHAYMTKVNDNKYQFLITPKATHIDGITPAHSPYAETASLTLVISTDKRGTRTMRVNVTPPVKNRPVKREALVYSCEICEKDFTSYGALQKHREAHNNYVEVAVDEPEKMDDAHLGIKVFQCGFCNVSFGTLRDLNVHLKAHEPFKSFECGVCGRIFSRHSNLMRHIAIHKGEGILYQ